MINSARHSSDSHFELSIRDIMLPGLRKPIFAIEQQSNRPRYIHFGAIRGCFAITNIISAISVVLFLLKHPYCELLSPFYHQMKFCAYGKIFIEAGGGKQFFSIPVHLNNFVTIQ
jgi:hypothetical protein